MKHLIFLLLFPVCLFGSTKVAIIGDSISKAKYIQGNRFIDVLAERYEKEGKDIELINRSYGCAMTDTLKEITVSLLTTERPDYIVIFLGINDAGGNVPEEKLYANFEQALWRATPNCKRIIIGEVDSITVNPLYNFVLKRTYERLAAKYHPYFVSFLTKEVLDKAPDGLHPGKEGHQMIAEYLYEALKECGV